MDPPHDLPSFDEQVPNLTAFLLGLTREYTAGHIATWEDLELQVQAYFTPERLQEVGAIVPGWEGMASYANGTTLTHVMCAFLGLHMMPEFQALPAAQQQLAKWIVLFHDVEKVQRNGQRSYTHAFRSAVTTAAALKDLGFAAAPEYEKVMGPWRDLTLSAIVDSATRPREAVADNRNLPGILHGIEAMYGKNSPAALIIKGVLFHMSINVVSAWPQVSPLTDEEIVRYIEPGLVPLLKVMYLADNEGWSLFEPDVRSIQRLETLETFERIEKLIQGEQHLRRNDMHYKNTVRSGYNKIADQYLAERGLDAENVHLLSDFIDLLAPGSRVLDAGCGAGIPITKRLAEHFDVVGVDFSEAQVERAARNVPQAQFICADMTELDFPAESLDGICSYYAIIHIPRNEHKPLLSRFYDMLKTGGVALLCLGAEDLVDDLDEDYFGTRMYWSHFDANTYVEMLKECGFFIIWAKLVKDETFEGAKHLFALVQKRP